MFSPGLVIRPLAMLCLGLCVQALHADEADTLLGKRQIYESVRIIIDGTGKTDSISQRIDALYGQNVEGSDIEAKRWSGKLDEAASIGKETAALRQWLSLSADSAGSTSGAAFRLPEIRLRDVIPPDVRNPEVRMVDAVKAWENKLRAVVVDDAAIVISPRIDALREISVDTSSAANLAVKLPEIKIPGVHVLDVVIDVDERVKNGLTPVPGTPDIPPARFDTDRVLSSVDDRFKNALSRISVFTRSINDPGMDPHPEIAKIDTNIHTFTTDINSLINSRTAAINNPKVDQRISAELADVTKKVNEALDPVKEAIDGIGKKVGDAVGNSLDMVKAELLKKADENQQKRIAAKAALADLASKEPPERKHCIEYCAWYDPRPGVYVDTDDYLREHAKWESDKAKAQAVFDAANNEEQQMRKAAGQMDVQKAQIEGELSSAVNAAKDKLNVGDLSNPMISGGGGGLLMTSDSSENANASSRTPPLYRPVENAPLETSLSTGKVNSIVFSAGAINISTGYDAYAQQRLATIGGGSGVKEFLNIDDHVYVTGALNAAIGARSAAEQTLGSMGTFNVNQQFGGNIKQANTMTGAVNVAIGYNSQALQRMGSIGGSAGGDVTMTNTTTGAVNAAIGNRTNAFMQIGNLDGKVGQGVNLNVVADTPLAAALGSNSTASIRSSVASPDAKVQGHLDMSTTLAAGVLAVSLGANSSSTVEAGVMDGAVRGNVAISQLSGNTISTSIGYNSTAMTRMAAVSKGATIGGNLDLSVMSGEVITFALGSNTTAKTELGVVDANVDGNTKIRVKTSQVLTGTIGINTAAETVVGSVKSPVAGDVDISLTAGSINTMAIGLSSGKTIYSSTYLANVLAPVRGSANINTTIGAVTNLGLGLVLDLGVLGTLDLSRQGCINIANIYSKAPC